MKTTSLLCEPSSIPFSICPLMLLLVSRGVEISVFLAALDDFFLTDCFVMT